MPILLLYWYYLIIVMVYIHYRLQAMQGWLLNLITMLLRRFRWGFVLAGFTALAMAAISWTLESSESYWVWHRYDSPTILKKKSI